MRWLLIIAIQGTLFAQTYSKIMEDIDNSPTLQSAKELYMAAGSAAEAAKGRSMPTIDIYFDTAWLKDTPTATFRIPGFPVLETPVGTKRNFSGSLRLAYPLFTGFALSAQIDKAKLEHKRAELKLLDLKRNLYIMATELASACYAADKTIAARIEAKIAMDEAYKKAKGLYDNGLLPPADLYNIEAKRYVVEAEIVEAKTEKRKILNRLGYILNRKLSSVELSFDISTIDIDEDFIIKEALLSREDIKALRNVLMIDRDLVDLAKSRFYPIIALAAELKRKGNTPRLNGDGFTNPDQSYIGASATWNLFSGFADSKSVEAARYKQLASKAALNDYKNRVKTELKNAFLDLLALNSRLQSARMELKARKAYCDLTRGRFENQLADADELSRSIAELFASKAKVYVLESRIFNQKALIWLMAGIEPFKSRFLAGIKSE